MKIIKTIFSICVGLLCVSPFAASLCPSAQAETVTVTITGIGSGSLGDAPFASKSFAWSLTYDTTSYSSIWGVNQPIFLNPVSVITLQDNPTPVNVTQEQGVWVYNTDQLWMAPISMVSGAPAPENTNILTIKGDPAWNGFSQPYQSANITSADFSQFSGISTDQGSLTMASGMVTSVAATPEPSSIALLAASGGGLALLARSRKRRG